MGREGWHQRRKSSGHETPEDTITDRELECVGLLAEGLTAPGIADFLGTSGSTVKRQLSSAYGKIGVTSCIEAIAWWHERCGLRAELAAAKAQLDDAEKTIALFGEDFQRAVEAEAGRMVRLLIAVQREAV